MDVAAERYFRQELRACFAGVGTAVLLLAFIEPHTHGQVPVTGRGKNFVAPVTDAQGRKSVLKGEGFRPAANGLFEVTNMVTETYRGREKDMTVHAPQCLFDPKANVASSAGPLSIATADERLGLDGEAFSWHLGDTRLNSKLVISNRVHALVRKRSLSGIGVPSGAMGGRTNSPAGAPTDFIDITSTQFEYQSDSAVFRGQVRVHDTEGDLSCALLTVMFGGENGGLERIEAEDQVVLNQGTTRAMADKAVYTVSTNKEVVEFTGHAVWEDGARQGSGERILFDRRTRTLHAEEKAYLKAPRSVLGASGLLAGAGRDSSASLSNAPAAFVEIFADVLTLDLPPTNGPIRRFFAETNVLILDAAQDTRALADRAAYEDQTGVLELTGAPLLESEHRLVNGKVLRFARDTRLFTAGPDAYVKLPFQAVAGLGVFPSASAGQKNLAAATNQFIEVWAGEFKYYTNRLEFHEAVRADFLQGDVPRGKLSCDLLRIDYGEQVQSIVAQGKVEAEQFGETNALSVAVRRVSCDVLRAMFNAQGRLESASAETGVKVTEEKTPDHTTNDVMPSITTLTSDKMTAFFTGTNRLERILAEPNVLFTQDERSAQGAKAVYTAANNRVELTGQPTARLPEGEIREAEKLVWDRSQARFIGKGRFKSEWKRLHGVTNQISAAAP